MTRPRRYIIRMLVFLAIVAAALAALAPHLVDAFMANVLLNGLILGVLFLGILYIFRQVLMLTPEVAWLQQLQRESSGQLSLPAVMSEQRPPRLLAPMANMLGERKGRLSLSALSMRTLLDGISSRINESHEISRYLIGLLIFLGLLGTFWGLLETVNAVGDAIAGLRVTSSDATAMFGELQSGLAKPLSGMGTAFSSSLFGLAGSLVLGFLELQAGQAHNRFMNDLEEWLSRVTRLSSGGPGSGESDHSVPAYIQALLEQTADSLENLQRTISQGEEDRQIANRNLSQLTERLSTLTDQMRTEQSVMMRLAETQQQIRPILEQLSGASAGGGMDDTTRDHIRNLDYRLERLVEEASSGRDQIVREMRNEIRLLARTIAALAEEGEQQ
jgi:hypothetical protein